MVKFVLFYVCLLVATTAFSQIKVELPAMNKQIIDSVTIYGPTISPTYQKAVCTEFVIKIIEKFHQLDKQDKIRIRIITNEDIYTLLENDSPVTKGVYYALTAKGIGYAVDNVLQVLPGDFVQFWTNVGWGHCGIVKSVDVDSETMELYSSFPSTDGYGVQQFPIPQYCFFVRMK